MRGFSRKKNCRIRLAIRFRMALSGNTGVRRIVNATFFSFAGLRTAWRTEAAFRQECLLCIVLIPAACWLGRNAVERSLLIGVCLLVLVTELLNTAVEYVVDRVGTDQHPLSGHAKDLGSAAVFVSLALAVIVWGLIGWQRFA
jgi:diacylglycerol kinase (ATP)